MVPAPTWAMHRTIPALHPPASPADEAVRQGILQTLVPQRLTDAHRFSHLHGRLINIAQQLIAETVKIGLNARNQKCRVSIIAALYRLPNSFYLYPIHTQSHPAPNIVSISSVGYLSDASLAKFADFLTECAKLEAGYLVSSACVGTYDIAAFLCISKERARTAGEV